MHRTVWAAWCAVPAALSVIMPASAEYADAVMSTPGLVGYWRLDEAVGNALDATAQGNHGVYTSQVLRQQAGPSASNGFAGFGASNYAAGFAGVGSYIDVPDDDLLDIGTGDLTVEAWVLVDESATLGALNTAVGKMGTGSTVSPGPFRLGYALAYRESLSGSTVNRMEFNARTQSTSGALAAGAITRGAWHHIVGVTHPNRDGGISDEYTVSGWSLFIDGVLVQSVASTLLDGQNINSPVPLRIGEWSDNTNNLPFPWFGLIDEVAVYNRALSSQQIAAHYQAALVPEPASLALLGVASLLLPGQRRARKG